MKPSGQHLGLDDEIGVVATPQCRDKTLLVGHHADLPVGSELFCGLRLGVGPLVFGKPQDLLLIALR